jgi:hypothetical protein
VGSVQSGEVDEAVDGRGGAGDSGPCSNAPAQRTGSSVEGVEVVVVGADENESLPDGW